MKNYHTRSLMITFFAFLFITLFILMLLNLHHPATIVTQYNQSIADFFSSIRNEHLDKLMVAMTLLGDKLLIPLMMLGMLVWLTMKKEWFAIGVVILSLILVYASVGLLKEMIESPRPALTQLWSETDSFPSGHTTLSLVFFGLIALLLTKYSSIRSSRIYSICGLFFIVIAISRLYLGAHWFSDVVGGSLLAISILLLCNISFSTYSHSEQQPWRYFVLFTTVWIALTWSGFAYLFYEKNTIKYQPLSVAIEQQPSVEENANDVSTRLLRQVE